MRSRYTAFVLGDQGYLESTTKGAALAAWRGQRGRWQQQHWQRLEIIDTPRVKKNKGVVEFKAYYIHDGRVYCLHERSRFQLLQGRWYYVDGTVKS